MRSALSVAGWVSAFGVLFVFGCSSATNTNDGAAGAAGSTMAAGGSGGGGVVGGNLGGNSSGASGAPGASGGAPTTPPGVGGATTTTGGAGGMSAAGGMAGAATGGSGGAATGGASGSGGVNAGGAAGAATGGAGGSAQQGMFAVPRGMSAGCGKLPPGNDSSDNYTKHDLVVTGVDPQFIADHPSDPGNNGGYTYTMRNYYVKLPSGYDQNTPYAVTFGGGGCGNTSGDSGKGGGQQASGIAAIQIGMSYVYSGGACFEDGYSNTPEVPYFDAMIAEISANYCVNLEKVFVGGYSSGAWESITLGLARGGVIRGIATGAGGLRMDRPPPSNIPIAAILLTGAGDNTNPADGPTGSQLARDLIMQINGCVGTDSATFAGDGDCVQYTGCPAAFPVVWCRPPGGHTGGSAEHWAAVGAFWDALPPVP